MAEFIIVRHGETTWNSLGRLQGQLESELNETGLKQALAVAETLATEHPKIDAFYSSDLKRAADTAQIIADKCGCSKVFYKESLRERHLGRLQGLTRGEAHKLEPKSYQAFTSRRDDLPIPGGGESVRQLHQRVKMAIEDIAQSHQGQKVVIVTHGGVIRSLYLHASGLSSCDRVLNASINRICISADNGWSISSWGDAKHLKGIGHLASSFGGDAQSA